MGTKSHETDATAKHMLVQNEKKTSMTVTLTALPPDEKLFSIVCKCPHREISLPTFGHEKHSVFRDKCFMIRI